MGERASGLESQLITDPTEIAGIEDEWRAMAELRGNGFITPEWFRSWWANRPDGTSPVIAAAHKADGSLAGVMPLVLDFSRRPRMIRFAGASFGDRFGPAAAERDELEVAAASMVALRDAGLDRYTLMLDHVEPDQQWWQGIRRESAHERASIVQQRSEQPYIDLRGLDWESYLASRSSSFRKKLRQRERKLTSAYEVVDRTATDTTLEADLARFFDLHESRWEGGSALDAPGAIGVLRDFAVAAQRRGWLRLRLLEVDGTAVAAFLGWRLGDRYTFYQSGFEPDWGEFSVGIALLTRTIQSAIEEGATEFDMLLGTEAYKRRFQNAGRDVNTVVLPRAMAPARVLVAAEVGARRLGRRVIEHPEALPPALRRMLPTSRGV